MNNIPEYQNLIELLKKTLEFYSNQDNYIEKPLNDGLVSLIEMDGGQQADFALKKIKEFNQNRNDNVEEYLKNIAETLEENDDVDDLYKKLTELRKLADGNK